MARVVCILWGKSGDTYRVTEIGNRTEVETKDGMDSLGVVRWRHGVEDPWDLIIAMSKELAKLIKEDDGK